MIRPKSIELFERCYLGGWAVGLINTVIRWSDMQSDPRIVEATQAVGTGPLLAVSVIGLLIPLILWFFIARKGSVIAKWILVVITAIGVVSLAFSLARGALPTSVGGLLGLVGITLNIVAATLLFRPDAKLWFGESLPQDPVA